MVHTSAHKAPYQLRQIIQFDRTLRHTLHTNIIQKTSEARHDSSNIRDASALVPTAFVVVEPGRCRGEEVGNIEVPAAEEEVVTEHHAEDAGKEELVTIDGLVTEFQGKGCRDLPREFVNVKLVFSSCRFDVEAEDCDYDCAAANAHESKEYWLEWLYLRWARLVTKERGQKCRSRLKSDSLALCW